MDDNDKKAMAEWMKGQSLLDCYKQYSDPNNHNLRIILEVIHYMLGVNNLFDYFKKEEEILTELKERYPGLMTIGGTADLLNETDKYFETTKEIFEDVEVMI